MNQHDRPMPDSALVALLVRIGAGDGRGEPTETDLELWRDLLDPTLSYAEANAAMIEHRRTSTEFLQPVHINRLVAVARTNRVRDAGRVEERLPADLAADPAAERAWGAIWRAAIHDGQTPDEAQDTADEQMRVRRGALQLVPMPGEVRKAIGGFVRDHGVSAS